MFANFQEFKKSVDYKARTLNILLKDLKKSRVKTLKNH